MEGRGPRATFQISGVGEGAPGWTSGPLVGFKGGKDNLELREGLG